MREATQTVSSWERKLFIIGHSPVAFVPGGSHTSGSRASRSRRQARSGGELVLRAAIVAEFAPAILQHPWWSSVNRWIASNTWFKALEVSTCDTLVLLAR